MPWQPMAGVRSGANAKSPLGSGDFVQPGMERPAILADQWPLPDMKAKIIRNRQAMPVNTAM
jgi:hypothetical protein